MYKRQEKERAREISEKLEKSLSQQVFSTIIPRCDLLAEAPSEGKPIMYIDPDAKGTLAYFALAGEIIMKFEDKNVA